jgi:hypothetical protein
VLLVRDVHKVADVRRSSSAGTAWVATDMGGEGTGMKGIVVEEFPL